MRTPPLSRIAENLYWMGRYVERAENTARLLGVNFFAMVEAPLVAGLKPVGMAQWAPLLDLTDDVEAFADRHAEPTAANVVEWFTIDAQNPGSIASSVAQARENGRTLRGHISTEMWETLNSLHLWIQSVDTVDLDDLAAFCVRVRDACQLFAGAGDATLLRTEGWRFLRTGAILERLDNTMRILQLRLRHTSPSEALAMGVEAHRSLALLKSLGAWEAYRRTTPEPPNAVRVAELLLLSPELPRSARFCADTLSVIARRLARMNPERGDRFARAARFQSAKLGQLDSVDALLDDDGSGLEELLDGVSDLSDLISDLYFGD